MTLLLLFNQPAAGGGGSATGTAFRSFVEAGMLQPDWKIDDYLVATVQTHDSTGQAAAADAVPSYVIRNAETGATIDSGNFAAVAGVDGFYVLRRQLTALAGFAAMTTYTLRVEALMSTVPAADSGVFRVGAWTEIRGSKNTLDSVITAIQGADGDTLETLSDQLDALPAAPSAASVADAVWDEVIAGHLAAGSTGAALNASGGAADPLLNSVPGAYAAGTAGYIIGSLTSGVVLSIPSPVSGSTITATIAATLAATLTGLTISADWAKVYLTVKRHTSDADAQSLLQVVVSNPAAALTDGALYVNGAAASVAQRTQAAITVTQATGTIALAIDEALTGALREGFGLAYDLKELTTSGAANVLAQGTWNWVYTPTWAVT